MNNKDWIAQALMDEKVSEKVTTMWDQIVWGAENIDLIPKIMGRVECEACERREILDYLYSERRYELFVGMVYAEIYGKFLKESKRKQAQLKEEP